MFTSKKLYNIKKIRHYFFSRKGGFSKGIYSSLNCGRGSKDKRDKVSKNLKYVSKIMKIEKRNLILMHQTHSNKVQEINELNKSKKIFADAIFSKNTDIVLGVVTADCVPVLFYDEANKIVGCIHAGWKGAFNGIIEKTIKKIKKNYRTSQIIGCVGPCIGKKSYEVNLNFYRKFIRRSKKNSIYFSKKNKVKKFFNLRKFVADKLLYQGVSIDHVNFDTFKEKEKFFSYRRSYKLKQNDYGRCISVIRLVN